MPILEREKYEAMSALKGMKYSTGLFSLPAPLSSTHHSVFRSYTCASLYVLPQGWLFPKLVLSPFCRQHPHSSINLIHVSKDTTISQWPPQDVFS